MTLLDYKLAHPHRFVFGEPDGMFLAELCGRRSILFRARQQAVDAAQLGCGPHCKSPVHHRWLELTPAEPPKVNRRFQRFVDSRD